MPHFMKTLLLAVLFLASGTLLAQKAPTASDEYKQIREEFQRAYKAREYPALILAAQRGLEFTHGNHRWAFNLAGSYALAAKPDQAFRLLQQLADAGLDGSAIAKDADYNSLHTDTRWGTLLQTFEQNRKARGTDALIVKLNDSGLLTEDITSAGAGRFCLSSVRKKKVICVDKEDKIADFADLSSKPGWPVFAILHVPETRSIWVTAAAMPNSSLSSKTDWGRSSLLRLDDKTGELKQRFDLPDDGSPHVFGDAALVSMPHPHDPSLVISDGLGGGVYMFHPAKGEFMDSGFGQFISPQTPVPLSFKIIVPDYVRGLAVIEPCLDNCQWVHWLKNQTPFPLDGIDGLYLAPEADRKAAPRLLAIQNGTDPQRILEIQLDAKLTTVLSVRVLRSDPALGEITHGVFTDGKFYFIANSGWDQLDDTGNQKPDVRPSPPEIRELSLEPEPHRR